MHIEINLLTVKDRKLYYLQMLKGLLEVWKVPSVSVIVWYFSIDCRISLRPCWLADMQIIITQACFLSEMKSLQANTQQDVMVHSPQSLKKCMPGFISGISTWERNSKILQYFSVCCGLEKRNNIFFGWIAKVRIKK